MPRRTYTPPPTVRDEKGRPRTKWDLLAEKEPPVTPDRFRSAALAKAHHHGLSDDDAPDGLPFVKRFK